jgi:hypothetical protein
VFDKCTGAKEPLRSWDDASDLQVVLKIDSKTLEEQEEIRREGGWMKGVVGRMARSNDRHEGSGGWAQGARFVAAVRVGPEGGGLLLGGVCRNILYIIPLIRLIRERCITIEPPYPERGDVRLAHRASPHPIRWNSRYPLVPFWLNRSVDPAILARTPFTRDMFLTDTRTTMSSHSPQNSGSWRPSGTCPAFSYASRHISF